MVVVEGLSPGTVALGKVTWRIQAKQRRTVIRDDFLAGFETFLEAFRRALVVQSEAFFLFHDPNSR